MGRGDDIDDGNPIRLASRASRLALAQTDEVVGKLAPRPCRVETVQTRGDEVQDRSLAELGGKGLFVKALEAAMAEGRADAAVHSAKDMEKELAEGTVIAACLEREDRRDALVGPHATIESLPRRAVVGTASVRRKAMLLSRRPDLKIRMLRGNVDTRIGRLSEGAFDAIVLAMAGLKRLGITKDVHPLDEDAMLPAAGQGAIAVQSPAPGGAGRAGSVIEALGALDHEPTRIELRAERALLDELDGSCHTPVGASARFDGDLAMTAALYSPDGGRSFTTEGRGGAGEAEEIGRELARELLGMAGGRRFIDDAGG